MGIYVYALKTAVREISGVKIGIAEYRYKPSYSWDPRWSDEAMFKKYCARRVAYFNANPEALPQYFVLRNIEDGRTVYECFGASFSDDGPAWTRVGVIKKVGRSYTLVKDAPVVLVAPETVDQGE